MTVDATVIYWDKTFIDDLEMKMGFQQKVFTCNTGAMMPLSHTEQPAKPCEGCGARKFEFSSGHRVCLYCHGEQ